MSTDAELDAMAVMAKALDPLDKPARQRVIDWAVQRFDVAQKKSVGSLAPSDLHEANGSDGAEFRSFAELFERTDPSTDKDKALVGAYWLQNCLDQSDFQSLSLNRELKNMGFGLSNVAETLRRCTVEKPALVLQIGKTGSKKGRKAFRLTQVGIQRVREMLMQGQANRDLNDGRSEISY